MACGRTVSRKVLLMIAEDRFGDEIQLEDLPDTMTCKTLITVINPDSGEKFKLPVRAILHGTIEKVTSKIQGE